MRYYFYTINYATLFRAICYEEQVYGKENSFIFYADIVSELSDEIKKEYRIKLIPSEIYRNKTNGLQGVINGAKVALQSYEYIVEEMKDFEEVTLFIFRDNEPQEATLIERLKKKYGNLIHIVLVEEGSGIYASGRPPIRKKIIKRMIYNIMGISAYALKNNPQGMNAHLEKIICKNPNAMPQNKKSIEIEQQINIFSKEFSTKILKIMNCDLAYDDFAYIFLGEPMTDFGINSPLVERYVEFIQQLIDSISPYGKLLIKPHPREKFDYSAFNSYHVNVLDEEFKRIPVECILACCENIVVLSLYSSANANLSNGKTSYYLYKLMEIKEMDGGFSNKYLSDNKIEVCNDFCHLNRMLEMTAEKKR